MSVLVTALVVGCGVLAGRLITQGPRIFRRTPPAPAEPASNEAPPKPKEEDKTLEGFPCQLGDVILRSMGDEAWLAGALVLSEGGNPVAVLFVSPEAGAARGVLARPQSEELLWLSESKDVVVVAGEPATALEIAGERYERRRRLPLSVERRGSGAPDVGGDVIFAQYTGLGDGALVVLAAKDKVVAFRGEALGPGTYDVLPGASRG
jgi:hypothetical protein